MTVAVEHVEAATTLVVMPDAFLVGIATVGVPGPITLHDFVRRSEGDFRRLDRRACVRVGPVGIAGHMSHAKGVMLPLHKVTVAVAQVAIFDVGSVIVATQRVSKGISPRAQGRRNR